MKTVFLSVLEADEKADALRTAIRSPQQAHGGHRFEVDVTTFSAVPRSPFAYWASDRLLKLFVELEPFGSAQRAARHGAATLNNGRFLRLAWEVPPHEIGVHWKPYAKGGAYSPFYDDIHLLVRWSENGAELKKYVSDVRERNGWGPHWTAVLNGYEYYLRPGLTWPSRTQSGFAPRVLPAGCIFDCKGNAAFFEGDRDDEILGYLAILLSEPFRALVAMQMAFGSYDVGVVQRTPVPQLTAPEFAELASITRRAFYLKRSMDASVETSHAFTMPALLMTAGDTLAQRLSRATERLSAAEEELAKFQAQLDDRCFDLYGIKEEDERSMRGSSAGTASSAAEQIDVGPSGESNEEVDDSEANKVDAIALAAQLLSWTVGVAFGRFDVRLATGMRVMPAEPEPFAPLPACSPAMLTGHDELPVTIAPVGYPIDLPGTGILVDDSGLNGAQLHSDDIVRRIRALLELLWKENSHSIEQETCQIFNVSSLREYIRKPNGFFQDHLKCYSKSRRKAPIYLPLGSESGNYTLWLYYPRLSDQTLYAGINDYLDPKLKEIERDLERLRSLENPDRKARLIMDELEDLQVELRSMRERLLKITALPYQPNQNDGVLITAAPLWQFFRHGPWRAELKKCWEDLNEGKYDWAQLAYSIWPDRVRRVCKKDRSIAIAHGLEDQYEG